MTTAEKLGQGLHSQEMGLAEELLSQAPPAVIFVLGDFRGTSKKQAAIAATNTRLCAMQTFLLVNSNLYQPENKPEVVVMEKERSPQNLSALLIEKGVAVSPKLVKTAPVQPLLTVMSMRAIYDAWIGEGPIGIVVAEDQTKVILDAWGQYYKKRRTPAPLLYVIGNLSNNFEFLNYSSDFAQNVQEAKDEIRDARQNRYSLAVKNNAKEPKQGKYNSLKKRGWSMESNGLIGWPYPKRLLRVLRHQKKYT